MMLSKSAKDGYFLSFALFGVNESDLMMFMFYLSLLILLELSLGFLTGSTASLSLFELHSSSEQLSLPIVIFFLPMCILVFT